MYFKVVRNTNKSDPDHFKSQYQLGEMPHLEHTEACGRRSVSILASYDEAVRASQQYQRKWGKCIAYIDLTVGHGVVHISPTRTLLTHHDWWVPDGVDANSYCTDIKDRIA